MSELKSLTVNSSVLTATSFIRQMFSTFSLIEDGVMSRLGGALHDDSFGLWRNLETEVNLSSPNVVLSSNVLASSDVSVGVSISVEQATDVDTGASFSVTDPVLPVSYVTHDFAVASGAEARL